MSLVYGGFYPLASTPGYADLLEGMPEGLLEGMGWSDIGSPAGYLGSTVFGILGPILAVILAISLGARAIAGDEESGSLELLLAHPVNRSSVVLQRAWSMLVALAGAGAVVLAAMLILRGPIDLDLPISHLAAAAAKLSLLGFVFGSLTLAAGAATGRRGFAIGVGALGAVGAYVANALGPAIDANWLSSVNPFGWFDGTGTLRDGLDVTGTLLLVVTAAAFLAIALAAISRTDIGT